MMPIWGWIGGGALLAGVLGGWVVRDWKADADILAAQEKAAEEREETEERWFQQSQFYQDQLITLGNRSSTFRETIRTEYVDVEVPMECAAPASINSVLNDAVGAANAAAAGESVTPVSGATHTPEPSD
jgi:hypothetical protein